MVDMETFGIDSIVDAALRAASEDVQGSPRADAEAVPHRPTSAQF